MNDKIKELAVQSDLLIKKTNGDEFRYGYFDPKLAKFAELIIQECVNIVENCDGDVDYARYLMQKHFGIE